MEKMSAAPDPQRFIVMPGLEVDRVARKPIGDIVTWMQWFVTYVCSNISYDVLYSNMNLELESSGIYCWGGYRLYHEFSGLKVFLCKPNLQLLLQSLWLWLLRYVAEVPVARVTRIHMYFAQARPPMSCVPLVNYIDSDQKFHRHVAQAVLKANQILGWSKVTFTCLGKCILRPVQAVSSSGTYYGDTIWNPHHRLDEPAVEKCSKLVPSIWKISYMEWLCQLELPSLKHQWLRGNLIQVQDSCCLDPTQFFAGHAVAFTWLSAPGFQAKVCVGQHAVSVFVSVAEEECSWCSSQCPWVVSIFVVAIVRRTGS